jgi:AraC-like DNA-binding protein
MLVFDSERFSPRERIDAYEDFATRRLSSLRVEAAGDDPFRVRAEIKAVRDISMVRLTGSGHVSARTSYEVSRQRHHFHVAVIQLDGQPRIESRTGTSHARPGDVSILSSMDTVRFGVETHFDHIIVLLPQRFPWAELAVQEKVVPASNPMRSVVFDFVSSVYAQADRVSPSAAAMLADTMAELMFAMCCEEPLHISTSTSLRAAFFDRACRIISSRAQDPDLHPTGIARQLGVSMRMLQRTFQENGATVAQRITTSRIEKSSTMLVDERMRTWTITQIAFACGFRDLTTFERSFSALKGMTPTAWRRRAPDR